jgi:hypothetical protein
MRRIATVRVVLAILGVFFLLANPAGICAGTPSAQSPSHPCCPTQSTDTADAPCICIDRQPAAPTVPSLSDQAQFDAVEPDAVLTVEIPVPPTESCVHQAAALAPDAILLSIHQLLL